MKNAVVFYSRDGSTRLAAKIVAERTGADLFELEEKKKRGTSPVSFMAAGFSALVGRSSRLKYYYTAEMKAYDRIHIGTPIWAGKAVPAVNSFIKATDLKGREAVVFTVQADENTEAQSAKGIDILKTALTKKGVSFVKAIKLHGAPPGQTADEADMFRQIEKSI
jgi:flavodoxin